MKNLTNGSANDRSAIFEQHFNACGRYTVAKTKNTPELNRFN